MTNDKLLLKVKLYNVYTITMFTKISSMIKKIDAAIDRITDNIAKVFITPEAARRKPDQNPKPKAKFTHEMGMSYF
ncbi:hypothetical protein BST79_gp116 [Only Syngen Nebraska virus 5]|uniref:hypothetical protein n=1 Tax=Only Syngen Nebraska virus 5 TaxID=1917232 RepID=UPI00090179CC|nr:hypothetical protein BST79_gp116 [Only Syngen Nebraska virus 5]APC25629.1 hypothetical protein [Only Syngen Nebraska virus 5]